MTKEEYGDNFQAHLLDQYKLYVEMADRISARRVQINNFYTSFLSGLLAFLSIVTSINNTPTSYQLDTRRLRVFLGTYPCV